VIEEIAGDEKQVGTNVENVVDDFGERVPNWHAVGAVVQMNIRRMGNLECVYHGRWT
jgi:hypothetical protein